MTHENDGNAVSDAAQTVGSGAPVLFVPDLLDAATCAELIDRWRADNTDSGMHRMVDGAIKLVPDASAKIRRDHTLAPGPLADRVMQTLATEMLPAIYKAFFYRCTRLERLKIVGYDAATGGYFRPHRDNVTPDAAHRRFAMTLNLNTGDYTGGGLRFPEYGPATYAPPRGGAVVFSCSLLHEVVDVTAGQRFALLTFMYGEEAVRAPQTV